MAAKTSAKTPVTKPVNKLVRQSAAKPGKRTVAGAKARPARKSSARTVAPDRPTAAAPVDRAREIARVRAVVRRHLPKGYTEAVRGRTVVWEVPLRVYPDTYNGHALWYAALAEQKNYISLHLLGAYGSPVLARRLADGFAAAGKKLDMGKACIRFKKADDLALDVIGEVVAALPMDAYVAMAKSAWRR